MITAGCYPARLKKVLIVTAPLWFKAPFKVLRLFVREKLRDRVFTVSIPQVREKTDERKSYCNKRENHIIKPLLIENTFRVQRKIRMCKIRYSRTSSLVA